VYHTSFLWAIHVVTVGLALKHFVSLESVSMLDRALRMMMKMYTLIITFVET
jgi:hypothetical protein